MMQPYHICLTYRLKFQSPFHCGTGLTNGLIDRSVQKDKEGFLYVPGSTVKGVLRETCEYLARILIPNADIRDPHDEENALESFFEESDIVECIFGSRYHESEIFFDNACMTWESKEYRFMQTENRTQTRLSRLTGTVMSGALYSIEFGISGLEFEGKIRGWLEGISNPFSDDLPGSYPLYLLIAGLSMTDRIGANRSTGMGYCQFNIQELTVNANETNPFVYLEKIEDFTGYDDARKEA